MKSIKTHIGVTISLLSLLMAIQFGFFVQRVMDSYEVVMKNEYSIVIAANRPLIINDVNLTEVQRLEHIDSDSVLTRLKDKISKENLEKLKQNLPKFYNVKMAFFPSQNELNNIADKLKKIKGVTKVEIFAKAHDSIYKILILLKNIIAVFTFLIVILGVLLMIRQIKIWLLEHTRRIEVMELLGAPFFLKSAKLYQLSFLDAILATILCICFYVFMPHFAFYINTMATIGIEISSIVLDEILILLGISLLTAFTCVSITMLSIGNKGTK